jgi:hypothetical protein
MMKLISWPGLNKQNSMATLEIQKLNKTLGAQVYRYISFKNLDARSRLVDSMILIEKLKNEPSLCEKLYDINFAAYPAAIATEGVLVTIAHELDFMIEKDNDNLGKIYTDINIEEHILKPMGISTDNNDKKAIRDNIHEIMGFVHDYRNKPLHRANGPRSENIEQAESELQTIINRIKNFAKRLIDADLIKVPDEPNYGKTEKEIEKMMAAVDPPAGRSGLL